MVSRTRSTPGYTYRRLEREQQSAYVCVCESRCIKWCALCRVYECNSNCQCGSNCANKLVQLGLQLRLQVFQTENKFVVLSFISPQWVWFSVVYRGWGIRCLDDIPKGTFVCTYSGDIHTDAGANKVTVLWLVVWLLILWMFRKGLDKEMNI